MRDQAELRLNLHALCRAQDAMKRVHTPRGLVPPGARLPTAEPSSEQKRLEGYGDHPNPTRSRGSSRGGRHALPQVANEDAAPLCRTGTLRAPARGRQPLRPPPRPCRACLGQRPRPVPNEEPRGPAAPQLSSRQLVHQPQVGLDGPRRRAPSSPVRS